MIYSKPSPSHLYATGEEFPCPEKGALYDFPHLRTVDSENKNHHENGFSTKATSSAVRFNSESSQNLPSDPNLPPSLFQRIMEETEEEFGIKRQANQTQFYSSTPHLTSQFSSDQSFRLVSAYSSSTSTTTCSKRKAEENKELNPQEKRKKTAEKLERAQQNLVSLREETIKMKRKIDQFTHTFRTVHPSTTIPSSESVPVKLIPPQNLSKKEKEIMLEEKLTEQAQRTQKRVVAVMEIVFKEAVEIVQQKLEAVEKSQQLEERNAQLELENARLIQMLNEKNMGHST